MIFPSKVVWLNDIAKLWTFEVEGSKPVQFFLTERTQTRVIAHGTTNEFV